MYFKDLGGVVARMKTISNVVLSMMNILYAACLVYINKHLYLWLRASLFTLRYIGDFSTFSKLSTRSLLFLIAHVNYGVVQGIFKTVRVAYANLPVLLSLLNVLAPAPFQATDSNFNCNAHVGVSVCRHCALGCVPCCNFVVSQAHAHQARTHSPPRGCH